MRESSPSSMSIQPPGWIARGLLLLLRGYRLLLSPWLGSACRFEPSCSRYAIEAVQRHGAAAGSYLATRRVLRCHPFCAGGHDPVPAQRPFLPGWRHCAESADFVSRKISS